MRKPFTYFLCGKVDCIHQRGANEYGTASGLQHCDYIGDTGHKRPCKPTPECICYEPRTKKRKGNMYRIKGVKS